MRSVARQLVERFKSRSPERRGFGRAKVGWKGNFSVRKSNKIKLGRFDSGAPWEKTAGAH